jgi:hypothetical protein
MTSEEKNDILENCPPGSWWVSKEDPDTLIQVLNDDSRLIDKAELINFKYWTGPNTNNVGGSSSLEEFVSAWSLKSR